MKHRAENALLAGLLTVVMTASALLFPVAADMPTIDEIGRCEMHPLPPMQVFADQGSEPILDGTVDLIDGIAVEWIDRVELPSVIRDFYDTLVEGADNDGLNDILIEDQYYHDKDFVIEVVRETLPLNGKKAEEVAMAAEDRYAPYLYAAFGAFDRDHPEVFWLNSAWSMGCSYSASKTECTISILVGIDRIRAENYATESSIKAAIAQRDAAIEEICRDFTWETTRYERVLHFNRVLTEINQYNTTQNLNAISHDCRESISALLGRVGSMGPVCEGYARAFKVLCDRNDIPCVLVDGTANPTATTTEGHMWNFVQMDDRWYGVDVTWNDPVVSKDTVGAVSGYESEDWLLVGSDTKVDGRSFGATHQTKNQVYAEFLAFINGPEIHSSAYESALTMALDLPQGGYAYDGTPKAPRVVVKFYGRVLNPTTDYSVTYSNNRDAGTATVRVSGRGLYNGVITQSFSIDPRTLTPTVSVADKVYDGTDTAEVLVSLDPSQLLAGDGTVCVKATGVFSSVSAGTSIPVIWTMTLEGERSENYRLAIPTDTVATIARRAVTVRAEDFEMRGTETEGWLTYTVDPATPLIRGDELVGKLDFDPNGVDGKYAITRGTVTNENNPNYDITFISATLTIIREDQKDEPATQLPDLSDPLGEIGDSLLSLGENPWLWMACGGGALLIVALIAVAVVLTKRNRGGM